MSLPQHTLARYIPVVRLLESLGGSEGYEKDSASYGDALKKQLTDYIPEDDQLTVDLSELLNGPKELEGGRKVTMTDLLRGVERLGGSKSFEEHVRKLETPELQVNQVESHTHGLKVPEDVEYFISGRPHINKAYAYKNYAHMSTWTIIFYVSIEITADIGKTKYIMNGHTWGVGGSFSFYEAGRLHYNNAPAGNPNLSGDVDVLLNGVSEPVGLMVVTTYKNGADYANEVSAQFFLHVND
ncbi:uncharacterized protein KY384_002760 [Bacidia gigantensis]|uniref:uncharacterized protein n=1 Tax=Bacidia gigantensis TaxID=2732470 RepID=UPI001D04A3CB|nr:uncharacterized protein KY384_002760 [Bacidia gigantensis]KAG8532882.1 hypothetical protein KY384_002760 [Bacidia gigantensis]